MKQFLIAASMVSSYFVISHFVNIDQIGIDKKIKSMDLIFLSMN